MTLIDNWTKEINKMKHGILAWGMGINSNSENKTKLYTAALFIGVGLIGFLTGFMMLMVISGVILGLQVVSWLWGWVKNG